MPALCFLLWMIGRMVIDFGRAIRDSGAVSPRVSVHHPHGAIAVIGAVLAGGLFEYNLGDSCRVLTMFLVVTTAAYLAIRTGGKTCS